MATFALVSGTQVVHLMVSKDVPSLGEYGLIYTPHDVTSLEPQPSVGWTYEGGVWFPPNIGDSTKELWHGAGFNEPDATDTPKAVEAPADVTTTVEAPAEEKAPKKASSAAKDKDAE